MLLNELEGTVASFFLGFYIEEKSISASLSHILADR